LAVAVVVKGLVEVQEAVVDRVVEVQEQLEVELLDPQTQVEEQEEEQAQVLLEELE
jgi:hypothetical protein